MSSTRAGFWGIVLVAGLLLGACGGSAEPASSTISTSGESETTTTSGSAETTSAPTTPTSSSSLRDMRTDLGIGEVTLHASDEGGPHPTLGWDPVDGAATYWLVLRDGSGGIYWAWTGAATSVRVGGGDSSEINQTAALFESMTWAVSAFDAAGNLVALSAAAEVSP